MALRRSFCFCTLLCAIFLAYGPTVYAADPWQQGRQAFAVADYKNALEFFEAARDAGQQGPAVHYNIGVCQYKLALYRASAKTFTQLANQYPRMRNLAAYNLGLVAMKLDHPKTARRHFLTAYELSVDDEKLHRLSANMLGRADENIAPPAYWLGSVSIRAGFDNNVALRDELGLPAGTTIESPMADLFLSLQGPIRDGGHLRLDATAYSITYFDNHDYDQNAVSLGARYDWTAGAWRTQAGLYASAGTLGGEGFDQTGSARLSISRRLGRQAQISLGYRYDDVSAAESIFSGIDGSRQRFDIGYRWWRTGQGLSFRYIHESNDRRDPGVSPDRQALRVDYQYLPASGFGYQVGGQFRRSEYDRLTPAREEDLLYVYFGLSFQLPDSWRILGNFQQSDNNSTEQQFSYQRKVFTLGLQKAF